MNLKRGSNTRRLITDAASTEKSLSIVLIEQSAQDLADCFSLDEKPDWKNQPEAKAAYDKDLAAIAALHTAQAEIEAPLLLKINTLKFLDNAKTDEIKALAAINAEMLTALQQLADADAGQSLEDFHFSAARAVIAKAAQPTIIRLRPGAAPILSAATSARPAPAAAPALAPMSYQV